MPCAIYSSGYSLTNILILIVLAKLRLKRKADKDKKSQEEHDSAMKKMMEAIAFADQGILQFIVVVVDSGKTNFVRVILLSLHNLFHNYLSLFNILYLIVRWNAL